MTYIPKIFCIFASLNKLVIYKPIIDMQTNHNVLREANRQSRAQSQRVWGRSELAQLYFPQLQQKSAWQKLKSWLSINPRLRLLASLTRRTFTPAEVALIYAELGEP